MNIEALRTEPDDPGLTGVVVEGRIVSVVPTHDIEPLGLAVGQPWDQATQSRVEHSLLVDRARRDALILLADGVAEQHLNQNSWHKITVLRQSLMPSSIFRPTAG